MCHEFVTNFATNSVAPWKYLVSKSHQFCIMNDKQWEYLFNFMTLTGDDNISG